MSAQGVIVAVIVIGCCGYAVWTLMPGVARRSLAAALMRLPLPTPVAMRFKRFATLSSGCGCDGCDRSSKSMKNTAPGEPKETTVKFYTRPRY